MSQPLLIFSFLIMTVTEVWFLLFEYYFIMIELSTEHVHIYVWFIFFIKCVTNVRVDIKLCLWLLIRCHIAKCVFFFVFIVD